MGTEVHRLFLTIKINKIKNTNNIGVINVFLAVHARIELAAPDRQSRMLATTPMDLYSHFKTVEVQLVCICCSFHRSPYGNRTRDFTVKG